MNRIIGHKFKIRSRFLLKRLLRSLHRRSELEIFGTSNERIEVAYVINLDRKPKRWRQFVREANYQKVFGGKRLLEFCHRVPAVDGQKLALDETSPSIVAKNYELADQYYVDPDPSLLQVINEKIHKVTMTNEEVAVALSHISVWKRIVYEGIRYALVLEDDAFFEPEFATQINRAWEELPANRDDGFKFDLLYVSYREVARGAHTTRYSTNLNRPVRGFWWLSGYVLSRVGAKKLLGRLPVIGPVDLWMNHQFSKLDVYSTAQSMLIQRDDFRSDNNYSILPIVPQRGLRRPGKKPVFVISQHHSTSDIIDTALSILGYRCCNGCRGNFSDHVELLIDRNEPLLFDAYVAVDSINSNYTKLDTLYPDAVFILGCEPNLAY